MKSLVRCFNFEFNNNICNYIIARGGGKLIFLSLLFFSHFCYAQNSQLALEGLCGKHAQKQFIQLGSTTSATFASSLNFNQFNNASIYLLGDFVIDVPIFTFNQCAIKINNGKSIYVQNGKNLVIRLSDLFSCDKLWKGIILDNEARLDLFTSNIEDAYNVIQTNENSIINLGAVSMNKNWIGITNSNSKSPIFGIFGLNRFTCSSNLRASWSNWFPTGNWSQAGMDFTGCTVIFGNPAINTTQYVYPSQFDRMNYGVIANDDAIVSIRACSFDALTTHGLWFLNSHLKFQGLINGTSLWPTITNCGQNGITAISSQLDIQNTNFNNNTLNAIQSRFNNLEEYISIRRNLVQNNPNGVSNGIFFWRSSGLAFSTNNIIHNNVINMAGNNPNSIALQIVGVNNATDNLLVDSNNISINEIPAGGVPTMGRNNHGILYSNMNNSGYGDFNQNIVSNAGNNNQSTVAGWAMVFLNNVALPHTIRNNTITAIPNPGALGGASFSFWNIWCGIHADGSSNLRYCSNTIQGCYQAIHKLDANAISDAVVRNNILSNWRGLSQLNPASFGNQLCRQNTFLRPVGSTNFYNDAAFNTSLNSTGGVFTYNQNIATENPTPRINISWFSSNNACQNLPPAACPIAVSNGFVDPNDLDERIATGQEFPESDVSYNAWSGRYKLYTAIKTFPTSFSDSIYQQFASQYASTGMDKLYQVETLIHEGTVYTEANGIQKRQYDQSIDSLLNNAIAIDEIINADSILNMNALLMKKRIISKIDSVRLLRGSLKSSTFASNTLKLQQALDILSNWSASTTYEINDKIVRQYYLNQIKNGRILSQGAVDTLLGIALACPFDEGQAVYFARAILQANNYNYVYDYPDKECIAPRSIEQKLTENKVVVFPNPARNEIKLISKNAIVQVEMFDMNGAVIFHKLSGNINKIDISNLPIGIYVLKIEDIEGNIELHKFIKN